MFKAAALRYLLNLLSEGKSANDEAVPQSSDQAIRTVLDGVPARWIEPSALLPEDDNPFPPSARLFDIVIDAIQGARKMEMTIFEGRPAVEDPWYKTWPGEHYRLLASLVRNLKPKIVIEIGTWYGMGALSLAQEIGQGTVHTFDIVPWNKLPRTWFRASDFEGAIQQHLADFSKADDIQRFEPLIAEADIIFVDAPKNGVFEPAFLANFERLKTKDNLLVIFDDVRVVNMLGVWRKIRRPKLDLVSFGHFTGTGLVDWNGAP